MLSKRNQSIRIVLLFLCVGIMATPVALGAPGEDTENVGPSDVLLGSLISVVTETGYISMSADGLGTNGSSGIIQVEKPAGATVRSAFMGAASTGWSDRQLVTGDVKIDGVGFPWDISTPSSIHSWNHWVDVTSIVKSKIDAAAAGRVNFTITEVSTSGIDGEMLVVIFDDPNQLQENTIALFFGAQAIAGDDFFINLADPLDLTDPNMVLDMSLGISYGWQPSGQVSHVDVNGARLTSSAGGQDDGGNYNGTLLTVGGLDDSNANPAPYAPASSVRTDDELYDLKPFTNNGDQLITVHSINPSNDDNIFFASFFLTAVGSVSPVPEDVTPPVVTCPSDIEVACSDASGTSVSFTATATDDTEVYVAWADAYGNSNYALCNLDGTFGTEEPIGQIDQPYWVYGNGIGDFDNDGDYDYIIGTGIGDNPLYAQDIYLYEKLGAGNNFAVPVVVATWTEGTYHMDMAVADYNNDGNMDFVVTHYGSVNCELYLGDGSFGFTQSILVNTSSIDNMGADAADLNNDGNMDFVTTPARGSSVVCYVNLGNGDGTFTTTSFSVPAYSWGATVGDFDNDGNDDIICDGRGGDYYFFKGNGDGTFQTGTVIPGLGNPAAVNPLDNWDFNGDGNLDLVRGEVMAFRYYSGNGDGTFNFVFESAPGTVDPYCITAPPLQNLTRPPSPVVSCIPASGSIFPIGATTVVCTATDAAGNTAECSFNVTVIEGHGSIVGTLSANCSVLGTIVDAFNSEGELVEFGVTDASGNYSIEQVPSGQTYNVSVVAPLGYTAPSENLVEVLCNETASSDFTLGCPTNVGEQRTIGFWKHQTGVATGGKGNAQVDAATLCDYLDLIEDHFNSNVINDVVVYHPPGTDVCDDKLLELKSLINLKGSVDMIDRAKQQLMALLLNVASGKLSQTEIISADGATVSQAITYCDNVIDDPAGDHEMAKTICDEINNNREVLAGMIPLSTENIAYRQGAMPATYELLQNYPNPFNPKTQINFSLPVAGFVQLHVYNVMGQKVAELVNRQLEAGEHTETFDGRNTASGVYFYKLETSGFSETKKMMLLK